MKSTIAINTLAFHGYCLDTALEEIARLTPYIEPVFIAKYDPSLCERYFSENNARILFKRLKELRLKVRSVSSHMDLGQPDSAAVFKKRMEFAKAIGAGVILTNAGHKSREAVFYRNMEELALHAEKLDLIIAFENPGDGQDQLLETGLQGLAILDRIGSDRVKLNYDFSNIFTYSKSVRHPEQEVEMVLACVGHLHLKNVKAQEGQWTVCSIEEGIIDYRNLFRRYPALSDIPMCIELPLRFAYDAQFDFVLRESSPLPLEHIRTILTDSLEYLNTIDFP